MEHLLEIIKIIIDETDLIFWLETNGLIIGQNPKFASKLAEFPKDRLMITISIKHIVPKFFAKLTRTNHEEWCKYPLNAVEYLSESGCTTRVAFMQDWYTSEEIDWIIGSLLGLFIDKKGLKFENEDEELDYLDNFVDIENFRKYSSVPLKKKEIKDLLRE